MCSDYPHDSNLICAYLVSRSDFTLLWSDTDTSSKCKVTTTESVTYFVQRTFLFVPKDVFLPQSYDHLSVNHEQSLFDIFQTVLLKAHLSAECRGRGGGVWFFSLFGWLDFGFVLFCLFVFVLFLFSNDYFLNWKSTKALRTIMAKSP